MSKWLLVLVGVGLLAAGWALGRKPADQGPWTQYAANPFADMPPVCPAGYTLNPNNPAECLNPCPYGYAPDVAAPGSCTIAPGFTVDTSQIDANNAASERSMAAYQERAAADARAFQQSEDARAQARALQRIGDALQH